MITESGTPRSQRRTGMGLTRTRTCGGNSIDRFRFREAGAEIVMDSSPLVRRAEFTHCGRGVHHNAAKSPAP